MKHRPTIRDVARKAGLSLSTVSLVINNRGYVSPETRESVLKVVRELSYHPTRSARGLASKTSGNIGFILSEEHFSQAEPFYTRIFLGTEFEARIHNFYILLTTVGDQFDPDQYVPRFLLERNVDGIIIAGKVSEKLISYIDSLGLPIVLVDYEMKRALHSAVLIDNWRGGTLAVEHLTGGSPSWGGTSGIRAFPNAMRRTRTRSIRPVCILMRRSKSQRKKPHRLREGPPPPSVSLPQARTPRRYSLSTTPWR